VPTGRAGYALAFLVALAVILAQIAVKRADTLQPDERTYLEIVNPLVVTGVYTDGGMTRDGIAGKPGRFIAPAFPLLVAAIARADAGFARTLACFAKDGKALRNACGSLWPLYLAQAMVAAAGLLAIFAIAVMLTGSPAVAWGGLGVALASGEPASYARLMLTDTLAFATFSLALAGLVALVSRGGTRLALAAGAALGLAALARPSFLYLLYLAAVAVLLLGMLRGRIGTPVRALDGPALLAAGLAVMAPWMLRNLMVFGDTALTVGYGPFTLAQRIAYNTMTWAEWGAAWLFWFPDIGDDLARALLRPELTSRLGWSAPETFYKVGAGPLFAATEAAAGGPQHHLSYLLRNHVLGDLFKHSAVTLVLAWRGLWVGKWLAVVAMLLLWPFARAVARRGNLAPLLALVLPLAALVGLNAFVSVSIVRYNLPLLALFAPVVAWGLVSIWQRVAPGKA
jgi:hypothetical protein